MINLVDVTLPMNDAFIALVFSLRKFHIRLTSKKAYLYRNITDNPIGEVTFKVYNLEGNEDFLTIFSDDGAGKCFHHDEIASSYNFNPPAFANKTIVSRLSDELCSIVRFINQYEEEPKLYNRDGQPIQDVPDEPLLRSADGDMVAYNKSPSSIPPTNDQFSRVYTDRGLKEFSYAQSYPQNFNSSMQDTFDKHAAIIRQFPPKWPF